MILFCFVCVTLGFCYFVPVGECGVLGDYLELFLYL